MYISKKQNKNKNRPEQGREREKEGGERGKYYTYEVYG